jgi:micrococcal nuclease
MRVSLNKGHKVGYLILLSFMILAACAPASAGEGSMPTPPILTPTNTLPDECIPTGTDRQTAQVTRIIDGDTIEVKIDGAKYKVRYIGMDTPELEDDRADVRELAQQAKEFNTDQVAKKTVTLIKDTSDVDQYGRLLRYVIADGVFINKELVEKGYAESFTFPPDVSCSKVFNRSEKGARADGLGIWAHE